MIDFDLTEEQRLLRETVREFARSEIAPVVAEHERERKFPAAVVRRLWGELGLGGMLAGEEFGVALLVLIDAEGEGKVVAGAGGDDAEWRPHIGRQREEAVGDFMDGAVAADRDDAVATGRAGLLGEFGRFVATGCFEQLQFAATG